MKELNWNNDSASLQSRFDDIFMKGLACQKCVLPCKGSLWKTIKLCKPIKKTICIVIDDPYDHGIEFTELLRIKDTFFKECRFGNYSAGFYSYSLVSIISRGLRSVFQNNNTESHFCCKKFSGEWFLFNHCTVTKITKELLKFEPCILFYELINTANTNV